MSAGPLSQSTNFIIQQIKHGASRVIYICAQLPKLSTTIRSKLILEDG